MSHALENLVRTILSHDSGALFIEWPTGSGKTTNITEALATIIRGERKLPYIFFLTPENKNVDTPFYDLQQLFNDEERYLFDKYCLRLKAISDQVIEKFLSVYDVIPEQLRKTLAARKLHEAILGIEDLKTKKSNSLIPESFIATQRDAIVDKLEPDFRRELETFLAKIYPDNKLKKNIALDEHPWIKEIYPSSLVYSKRIIFLSVKKFLLPIDPIIAPSFLFQSANFIKEGVILFDEVDSACRTIRVHQIEEAMNAQVDLVDFFTRLHSMRIVDDFPSELLEDLANKSPKAATQRESFEQIRQRVEQIYGTYHLNWNFRLEDEGAEKSFLYANEETQIVFNGQNVPDVKIKPIKKDTLNRLEPTEKPLEDKKKGVKWMLGDMYGALKYIAKIVSSIARKYMVVYNEKYKGIKETLTIDQAINTVISNLHLDEKGSAILQKMSMSFDIFRKKKENVNAFVHDYYMEGYRFYNFVNNQDNPTRTAINMVAIHETPEKYFLSLCANFFVVGISATAMNPTKITNFNIEYLKKQLGNAIYKIDQDDEREFLEFHRSKQKKKQKPIIEVLDPKHETEDLVHDLFTTTKNYDYFTDELEKRFSKYKESDFDRRRFSMISTAIHRFLKTNKKVLLVMIGRAIKEEEGSIYSLPFWTRLCHAMADELGLQQLDVLSLVGKSFLEEKDKYRKKARGKGKIILFSTYPSVSTGQNLFYLDESDNKRDIDCLFIEKPMNIIPNIKGKNVFVTMEQLMEFFAVVEILNNNYEIDDGTARFNIGVGFRKFRAPYENGLTRGKPLNSTDSVNYSMVQVLEQTIGRLNRTKDESQKILYVDPDIISQVDFSCIENKELNIELRALIELSECHKVVEREAEYKSLKLSKITDSCRVKIERQLHSYDQSWSCEEMDVWTCMRETLLRHPTYRSYDNIDFLMQPMMMPSPDGTLIDSYSYKVSEKNPKYVFASDPHAYKFQVSSKDCYLDKLMAIDTLRQMFIEKGYATSFEPGLAIVNPVAYTNIYKGAIGEVIIRYMLSHYHIRLKPIDDPKKFELFDYEVDGLPDTYVDCKHWLYFDPDSASQLAKIREKMTILGAKRIVIVNLIRPEGVTDYDDGLIYFSKGLLIDGPNGLTIDAKAMADLRSVFMESK